MWANALSRQMEFSMKWSLMALALWELMSNFDQPDINMFTSLSNCMLSLFLLYLLPTDMGGLDAFSID